MATVKTATIHNSDTKIYVAEMATNSQNGNKRKRQNLNYAVMHYYNDTLSIKKAGSRPKWNLYTAMIS